MRGDVVRLFVWFSGVEVREGEGRRAREIEGGAGAWYKICRKFLFFFCPDQGLNCCCWIKAGEKERLLAS